MLWIAPDRSGMLSGMLSGDALGCFGLFWNDLGCSGMPWDALECFGLFWNDLGCSGMPWDALGCFGLFWNDLGCSGMPWDALGCSRRLLIGAHCVFGRRDGTRLVMIGIDRLSPPVDGVAGDP